RRVMARTHARVSRSLVSTVARSLTACARVARTEAESTSYCCAPARAGRGAASSSAARRLARGRTELGAQVRARLVDRHLRRRRVAAMLVLDHAFLQA